MTIIPNLSLTAAGIKRVTKSLHDAKKRISKSFQKKDTSLQLERVDAEPTGTAETTISIEDESAETVEPKDESPRETETAADSSTEALGCNPDMQEINEENKATGVGNIGYCGVGCVVCGKRSHKKKKCKSSSLSLELKVKLQI